MDRSIKDDAIASMRVRSACASSLLLPRAVSVLLAALFGQLWTTTGARAEVSVQDQQSVERAEASRRKVELEAQRSSSGAELASVDHRSRRARSDLLDAAPHVPGWETRLRTLREAYAEEDEAVITQAEGASDQARAEEVLRAHIQSIRVRVENYRSRIEKEQQVLQSGHNPDATVRVGAGERVLLGLEESRADALEKVLDALSRRLRAFTLLSAAVERVAQEESEQASLSYANTLLDELVELAASAPRDGAIDALSRRAEERLLMYEAAIEARAASRGVFQAAEVLTRLQRRLKHLKVERKQELSVVVQAKLRAESLGVAAASADEVDSLERLRARYRQAQSLFGENHVQLTPLAYVVTGERRGGVAGLISVPLLGVGGGYGFRFYPDVQTEEQEQAFIKFERGVRHHRELISAFVKMKRVEPEIRERRLAVLMDVFREMIHRDIEDGTRWVFDKKAELLRCLEELSASDASPEIKQERLDELWLEYEYLRDYEAPRRADLLLAPHVGIPITEDPTERFLLGGGLETHLGVLLLGSNWWAGKGWRDFSEKLRFTLSAGMESTYDGPALFTFEGWFVGVGLSGEFSDDFVNLATGASEAASSL